MIADNIQKISGWGNNHFFNVVLRQPRTAIEIKEYIKNIDSIARGNGRSYGDSSINLYNTIDIKKLNRILDFNSKNGLVIVEAGIKLNEIIEVFLPRGWFPYVTPGTKFVTIGGMVASDVHGKNHHKEGSFRKYVRWFDIMLSNGEMLRCSKTKNQDLFDWTFGGMGLTGIIINVAFKLKPISTKWIIQKTIAADNFEQTMENFDKMMNSTYSVSWIDCLAKGKNFGRSLLYVGEHAKKSDLPPHLKKDILSVSNKKKFKFFFNLPSIFINSYFIKIFNILYFHSEKNHKTKFIDYDKFFYPLDNLHDWNKIYGKKGFFQYQCVFPLNHSYDGIKAILKILSDNQIGSFLAVLKKFGNQTGSFSFPMKGFTIALDFPMNKKNLHIMNLLDDVVLKYKGRIYLAKDSRISSEKFHKSEKRIINFINFRKTKLKNLMFSSMQSKRLNI